MSRRAAPALSKPTLRILAQNAGRDPERLAIKLARMREDPFAFFRGTNPLFLELLPRSHPLLRAPSVLICGDLHLENYGAFKGENRLGYFDVNDFDEACLAPFTIDIVRFVASIKVAAPGLGLNKARTRLLVRQFLRAYRHAIDDGKPRWLERSLMMGVFRALLRRAARRTRLELLTHFTKLRAGRRRIRTDGVHALAMDAGVLARLQRFLAHLRVRGKKASFFTLVDAARRSAGNGSLGLPRYMLLVRARGASSPSLVLDLKFAAPSAVAAWFKGPQPQWPTEAARVVAIQRLLQAMAPALLQAVQFDRLPFVLKELQPSMDRLDLSLWRDEKTHRLVEAIEGMGQVAAWAHLRGCGHLGAVRVEQLQSYVGTRRWAEAAERLAESATGKIHRAWRAYTKDYDAGRVHAALKRS